MNLCPYIFLAGYGKSISFSIKEVLQIYVSCPTVTVEKEYRKLAAFAKTKTLKPKETQEIDIIFSLNQMASYDEKIPGWTLEAGYYGLWVGNSLESSKLEGAVKLEETAVLEKTEHICPLQTELKELHQEESKRKKRYKEWVDRISDEKKPVVTIPSLNVTTKNISYDVNLDATSEEAKKITENLMKEQLIKIVAGDPGKAQGGNLGVSGISVPGSAGETSSCAVMENIAAVTLADGPAGLRLMQYYYVKDGSVVQMPFEFGIEGGIFCPESKDIEGEKYYQYCTAFPVGTLLAQSWNRELLKEIGLAVGREMEEFGITLWLAPGMNIHRNPLCGRNFEYYSEDPLLSGAMAAAITKGVQEVPGCGATIKHFACNNQEDNRKGSNSIVSERVLREIYLRGFEFAIKDTQPMSMMTSYNLINGIHAANNKDLCTKVARAEWGFDGVIVTDWTTTEDGPECTAAGCIRAGNDLTMPGKMTDWESIGEELDKGLLTMEELKICAGRIITMILKSNRYDAG